MVRRVQYESDEDYRDAEQGVNREPQPGPAPNPAQQQARAMPGHRGRRRERRRVVPPRADNHPTDQPGEGAQRQNALRIQWMRLREARLIRIRLEEGMRELGNSEAVREIFSPPSEGEIMRSRLRTPPRWPLETAMPRPVALQQQHQQRMEQQQQQPTSSSAGGVEPPQRRPLNPRRSIRLRRKPDLFPYKLPTHLKEEAMRNIASGNEHSGGVSMAAGRAIAGTSNSQQHQTITNGQGSKRKTSPEPEPIHVPDHSYWTRTKRERVEQEDAPPLAGSSREAECDYNKRLSRAYGEDSGSSKPRSPTKNSRKRTASMSTLADVVPEEAKVGKSGGRKRKRTEKAEKVDQQGALPAKVVKRRRGAGSRGGRPGGSGAGGSGLGGTC